jgi:hypothetical protein
MSSTTAITVVLACAFLLGVKLTVNLVRHRRRKVEFGLGDVRPRNARKDYKAPGKSVWR